MIVIDSIFSPQDLKELEVEALGQKLRPVPSWLGDFHFKVYGQVYNRDQGRLPPLLRQAAIELIERFQLGIRFNAAFLQRYDTGTSVKEHRDPANNLHRTIIAPFGTYTGGNLVVENKIVSTLVPGAAVCLPCTVDGQRGPKHHLTKIETGTRWALILNHIVD